MYENRELASPGAAYGFDLPNGRVAPSGTPATFVDPTSDGLSLDTDYDLYIGRSDPLTPQQCSDAIDRSPGAHLRWEDLPVGRLFCVRSRKDRSVAVVRIVSHEAGSDAVRISLGYYRYDG
ncbi:hypothetical protein [Kitasatospora sp. NPDC059673]|uniref:hypothetical protein n=1 Tax=Kitasatospora sp. NPDC059673 TaxID=3346901 RepID=UPI00368234D3